MADAQDSPERDPYTDVGQFLGETHADFYSARFRQIGRGAGFVFTPNYAAALLGPFWWSARQLWSMAIVFWVLELNILARLFHGLFGNLGGEEAARAERLMRRSTARAEEAATALAAGEPGAERMAASAENLAKVANEAAAEAARLNAEAPMIVAVSLGLLLLVKGIQLVLANWMLERKYMMWRARRSTDARITMPGAGIIWSLIAITILVTVTLRVVESAPAWLSVFPSEPEWRNQAASAIDTAFDWATSRGGVIFDGITVSINAFVNVLERTLLGTPWPVILALVGVLAWRTAGARTAIFVVGSTLPILV